MEHFAGTDVSLKDSSICVIDAAGRIMREAKVASEPEATMRMESSYRYCMALIWSRSYYCSEQSPDGGGHPHGQRTPERDAYYARPHARAADARRQCTEKRKEEHRSS